MKFQDLGSLVCLCAFACTAIFFPSLFTPFSPYLSYLLGAVMLTMGLTLDKDELTQAISNWKFSLLGTFLQFLLMPLIAYILSVAFCLPKDYQLGLILVGCCPGGTASNVIVYLFRGNVSLSVLMTLSSTILAVFLTPLLLELYIGSTIVQPTKNMVLDIFSIVIIPLGLGYILHINIPKPTLRSIEKYASFFALITIALIIAVTISKNNKIFLNAPFVIILIVFLHNALGLILGYLCTIIFTRDRNIARTIAIEVGMQNSGLGVVLASLHFSAAAALPSVIFSLWHNITGITLAQIWKRRGSKQKEALEHTL